MKKNYIKHTLMAGLAALALVATAVPAQAQQNTRRPSGTAHRLTPGTPSLRIATADEETKTAYGVLGFDLTDYSYVNGMVTFPLEDGATFSHVRLFGDATHDVTAAAYAAGYYYVERTVLDGEKMIPCQLLRYDIEGDKVDTVGDLTGYTSHINDMSYDYSTQTMYAISVPAGGTSRLYTIDLKTAESATVADLDSAFFTLACTYNGQLFGITFNGTLCRIDKTTGALSAVGHTGWHPTYYQSMEFDHTDETLYWAADLRDNDASDFIAEVDTLDGLASPIGQVGNNPEIAGLYIPFTRSAQGTPALVSNLTATPDAGGANKAVISWTNPTLTFDGQPLTALTEVRVYRDKTLLKTYTGVQPGETLSYEDTTDEGLGQFYNYSVVAANAVGDGAEAKARVFVGHDTPAPVTDLIESHPAYDETTLSWTAADKGVNGGYLDKASLSYTVVRMPGNKVLASGLTDTQYTDAAITPTQAYYYAIIAKNDDGQSDSVRTASRVMGPAYSMPVDFDFTSASADNSWTVVDGNGDGYAWMWTTTSTGRVMGHQASNTAQADDWLISYYMPFEKGTFYRVDYDFHAYSADRLDFFVLDGMDYDAPLDSVCGHDLKGGKDVQHRSFSFEAPETGYYNLAIHATSPLRADWLEMYDLSVRKCEDYNLAAISLDGEAQPMIGKESVYTFVLENQGSKKTLAFRAILKDQDGNELSHKDVAKTLASGEQAAVELPWTPASADVTGLQAEVVLMGATDEYADDNVSTLLTVAPRAAFDGDLVSIGTTSNRTSTYAPFDFSNQHAAALSLYSADEIGEGSTYINKIAWPCDASSQYKDVTDAPVRVYMANTDATNCSAWIAEEDMTLVYEGKVGITMKSVGELTLDLQTSFPYQEGKNLAVLTVVDGSEYYPYVYFTQYTSPMNAGGAYEWGSYYSSSDFDFTQSGHSDYYGRTPAVMLYMSKTPTAVKGVTVSAGADYEVYDLNGRKVAHGQLSDRGTVDASQLSQGVYVVSVVKDGKRQTMKVSVRK